MKYAVSFLRAVAVLSLIVVSAPLAAQPETSAPDPNAITLNFPGVDIHQAAKAVLGDILGLNYAVDPAVQGTITLETTRPVTRQEVMALFESALKTANLALIKSSGAFVVVPLADARKQGRLIAVSDAGYGSEALHLRYISASVMKKLVDPLIPDNAISQADDSENIVIVTGTSGERKAVRDLVNEFDVNWLRGMAVAVFIPRHSDAKFLVPQLDQIFNAQDSPSAGRIRLISLDKSNAILAISPQRQFLNQVRRMLDQLDSGSASTEPRLFVYRVQNGRSKDLQAVLAKAFNASNASQSTPGTRLARPPVSTLGTTTALPTPQNPQNTQADTFNTSDSNQGSGATATVQIGNAPSPVTITSDETNNSLVIYATERQYQIIAEALHKLDIVPLQVMIEAAITEVTLDKSLQFGTNWTFPSVTGTFSYANNASVSSSGSSTVPGFSYLISSSSIQATLTALSGLTKVKIDSAPKLLVLNNQTASLDVGDQVPVATASAVSTDTATAPIVNSIQYMDTGVILKVTPRVNDGGLVLLDISQEVSSVSNTTSSALNSPTIQQRKLVSSIAIQDGQTVALGGLITDDDERGETGIPWLRSIPFLGESVFGGVKNSHTRTELIILLTPHVVRNAAEAQTVTDELHAKMKAIDNWPHVKL